MIAPFALRIFDALQTFVAGTPLGTTLGRFSTVDAIRRMLFYNWFPVRAGPTTIFMLDGDSLKLAATLRLA